MAGYDGYSKSNNAVDAESDGRYPMTAAKKIVAEKTGLSQAAAAKVLKKFFKGEWHHSSKYYNAVDYYDAAAVIRAFELSRTLSLPFDDSFVGAFLASGLEDEDDPLEKLRNPREYENTVEEFIEQIKTGEWK